MKLRTIAPFNDFTLRRGKPRARVVIGALGPYGSDWRSKAKLRRFFRPFRDVLSKCGIAAFYLQDRDGFERELSQRDNVPSILIDLGSEWHEYLEAHDVRKEFARNADAVFNSCATCAIIKDKEKTNLFLSKHGIRVPSLDNLKGKKIFSNARVGSAKKVFIYRDGSETDPSRYNTKFIRTEQDYRGNSYYTTVRLMCIGPHLLQIYMRARDVRENNPSVHSKDTPRDRELLAHLYTRLVDPRHDEYSSLAKKIGLALGPGFYAHDVLVDSDSGDLYVCETNFKFFDHAYAKHLNGLVENRKFQLGLVDEKTYAGWAASVFLTYCVEMGFL